MKRFRILLVDDNAVFARVAKQAIEELFTPNENVEVLAIAGSGERALARIGSERPDLVLMDVHMQDMDGIETTRRIKFSDNAPLVLMISTSDDEELRAAAAAAGADHHMCKACLLDQLPAFVRALTHAGAS